MKIGYRHVKDDYAAFKWKIFFRFLAMAIIALMVVFILYCFIWRGNGSEWVVAALQRLFGINRDSAINLYQRIFRDNVEIIVIVAAAGVFFLFLILYLNWFTRYFNAINEGIESLLNETEEEIALPPEMTLTERKLNTVKQTLKQRALEVQLAEQRKNDLVMYLAHDIRTPLTSVIGYLSLLDEAADMPLEQRAKYLHITLEKAHSLEKMINEFFEITRYNLQQITLSKEHIDLYYMLLQLTDELSPLLAANGNTAILEADENLTLYADPDKLARVFNNVLKNASAYSFPNTDITVSAAERDGALIISFINKGKTISAEKLSAIFEKFYRLDDARTSNTGGSGLGLAIAKEIVAMHGGSIKATSKDERVEFIITLPINH